MWGRVRLTLELATVTTLALIVAATPLAWWLARSHARWKEVVAAVVSLPMVLPPTVLGFYLLIALGPDGPGGALASLWGARTLALRDHVGARKTGVDEAVPVHHEDESRGADEPEHGRRRAGARRCEGQKP